jgi:LCP family protein required for cell wall assembly
LWLSALALVAVVAVAAIAGFASLGRERQAAVVNKVVATAIAPAIPSPQSIFGKQRIHVLVLGRDYDYDAHDIEYSSQSRSDVIMAFTIDFANHKITELSVPRDTAVTMPDGSQQKINAALSEGGVPESKAVVSKFLGVSFDRYALLRIDSTKQLIDAIGGVNVPVHQQIDYDDNWGHLHVHLKPGIHHMDGATAVAFSRFRHDDCGDPCRIARQQDVLHAIAGKLGHDKIADVLNAQALISTIRNNVTTDLSTRELLSVAWAFRSVDPRTIATAQVPYTGDVILPDGGDALVADDTAKKQLVRKLMLPALPGAPRVPGPGEPVADR